MAVAAADNSNGGKWACGGDDSGGGGGTWACSGSNSGSRGSNVIAARSGGEGRWSCDDGDGGWTLMPDRLINPTAQRRLRGNLKMEDLVQSTMMRMLSQ